MVEAEAAQEEEDNLKDKQKEGSIEPSFVCFTSGKRDSTLKNLELVLHYERKTRLELATPTLARLCSTN